jgi:hypothetical protein
MLFIQNFQICQAHIVLCLYYTGAWKTLPRKTMAHSHESSYTSNYLIVNCQKGRVSLPCKAMAHSHKLLRKLNIAWLFDGDSMLAKPRNQQQTEAENYIRSLAHTMSLPPSSLPHQNRAWGSDGSMIPATSGIGDDKSVTAAVTGPQTVVVRLRSRNTFILHGELIGLIMGLILSDNESLNNKLFTDHLNSVRFIDHARTCINQENHLRGMNGRSYYRWILNLVQRI